MNVLGISAYYHDASAALVCDGAVIAAAAEERFTLQKHDAHFPKFAVDFCLSARGLRPQDLDAVVFYEQPQVKFSRVFSSSLAGFPYSAGAFVRSMKSWMGSKLWIKNEISRRLDVPPRMVEMIPHHLSHAAQAFAASPFEEAAVLVVDAVGEWESTSLFQGSHAGGLQLKALEALSYPNSLGLVYAAFTAFLGFRVNDSENSTMALATFGKPNHADKIRRIVQIQADGTYQVDASYFTFDDFKATPFSRKFLDAFGAPRNFKDPLPFDCLPGAPGPARPAPQSCQYYADVAASVQLVLEEALLGLCRKLRSRTGLSRLCFAGGAALNCVANSRILAASGFEEVFIPPDPGDGGAAIGAALYGHHARGGRRVQGFPGPYLGKAYDASADLAMLEHLNPDHWAKFAQKDASRAKGKRLAVQRCDDLDVLAAETTRDLREGRIVGWCRGRFENGPRALGNRSILVDPGNAAAARRLSKCVKARAPFRPYAFSIAAEDSARAVELPKGGAHPARWMQAALPVREGAKALVGAATHVDGTARVQVCAQEDNPAYHRLLIEFGKSSGLAAVLNTSLNASGFPLVSSPAEALLFFARTDLDTLVLNDVIVRKTA